MARGIVLKHTLGLVTALIDSHFTQSDSPVQSGLHSVTPSTLLFQWTLPSPRALFVCFPVCVCVILTILYYTNDVTSFLCHFR